MASFDEAYKYGEQSEGGWANVKGDKGGRTYKGISENDYPNWPGWKLINAWIAIHGEPKRGHIFTDIPGLDDLVKDFFKDYFWDMMKGDNIENQPFSNYFYDWFINSRRKAVEKLQEILDIEPQTGNFGPLTLQKVNDAGSSLLAKIHARRMKYYNDHVAVVPEDEQFLEGWLDRSKRVYAEVTA